MTLYEQRPSGLVAPKEPPKPKPKRGYLEIEHESVREEAGKVLCALNNLFCGGILSSSRDLREAQKMLIRQLAQLLLGPDVEFEEKC